MKKRTVISIVITIICVILTNKFWFNIKPLQISLNAKGSGITKFEFFLNKKDNNDFKKAKYGVVETNIDNAENIEFFINRIHKTKKIKITITSPNQKKITLSKISLRYNKYKLDNLDAFLAENATLKLDGNKLVIYPKAESFSIIYNKPVNIKPATEIDIKILIVIAVLTFLLSYKLTSYLADFKILNNASRLDIIFLLIFFVLLFIPMSNIDTKTEKSPKENRQLSVYKTFIKDNDINFNYGEDFNNWFSDRFYLRDKTTELHNILKRTINRNYKDNFALIGKENWLFLVSGNSERNYLNLDKFSEKDLKKAVDYIVSIDNYCKKHNKKFIFLICPDKNKIYGEYYPDYYIKNIPDSESRANQLISELNKRGVKTIYPYNVLKANKTSDQTKLLYWKNDTHWSTYGAYTAYNESISKALNIEPVKIKIQTLEKHKGDISNRLPINYKDDTEYLTPKIMSSNAKCKQITNMKHNKLKKRGDIICVSKNQNSTSIVFYRDSFATNLIPFISENYSSSEFYWTNKVNSKEIDKFNIIVFETVERLLPKLAELKPIKEN